MGEPDLPGHGPNSCTGGDGERIGALLKRMRQARGHSQQRVAEQLCEVSGMPTVSRHEVSRWEREERVPGSFWLHWLAVVLEASPEQLEVAVGVARGAQFGHSPRPSDQRALWRPPAAADLLAVMEHAQTGDLPGLAHAWLVGPPEVGIGSGSDSNSGSVVLRPNDVPDLDDSTGRDMLSALEARLARLRRMDDVVGGLDLAGLVDRELREAIQALRKLGNGTLRRRALRAVAGYAQLAGWVYADAGDYSAARRAYRVGLQTAAAAGTRELTAHVLGSLSCQSLAVEDAQEALLVARTGLAGLTGASEIAGAGEHCGSSLLRALLLHRAALAAARLRERREAELMLVEAERVVDRSKPEDEPEWLYWLDHEELTAMTGRCPAMLGRPLRAVRVLQGWRGASGPRSAALYGCCLARSYLELGEVEEARRVMERVRLQVAGAGSVRVEGAVRYLEAGIGRQRTA